MKGLLALLLAAAPARAAAAPAAAREFRLLYDQGAVFNVRMGLLYTLEKALDVEGAGARLGGIETIPVYYSNDAFLFDLPAGASGRDFDVAVSTVSGTVAATVVETPEEALFISAPAGSPLVKEVLELASDRAHEEDRWYAAGARLSQGTLSTLGSRVGSASLLRLSSRAPGRWRSSMGLSYRLTLNGVPVTAVVLGKPLGGAARLKALLKKRLAEEKEPVVHFSLGAAPSLYAPGIAKDALLRDLRSLDYRFLAFGPGDMALIWDEMLAQAKAPSGVPLLCTNIAPAAPGAPDPIERTRVETVLGIRIGFISLVPRSSADLLARRKAPYTVLDPAAAARAAVAELRDRLGADLVVAVSHLEAKEDAEALRNVSGIDIYVDAEDYGVASRRAVTVDLSDWNSDAHAQPALRAVAPRFSYDELAVAMRPAASGYELARIEEDPGPTGPDAAPDAGDDPYEDAILAYFLGARNRLLPDPREVWPNASPPRAMYRAPEFWNLAAQLLRRGTGAEIAFLRILPLNSNTTGGVSESYVRQWLAPDQHVVVARFPGSAVRALLKACPFPSVPNDADFILDPEEIQLAASGVDKKARVNGIPLSDDEIYTVATTAELLERAPELPALGQAQEASPSPLSLTDAVIAGLQPSSGTVLSLEDARGLLEGKTPPALVWRVNLSQLSLQFADTQVQAGPAFSQVRDARVQAESQVVTEGAMKLFSEVYWDRMRWNTGVTADYGQLTLEPSGAPSITNMTEDQLVFETELTHRTWYLGGGPAAGPFVNVSYNTQFTKPPNTPKDEALLTKAGLELFDGSRLKALYAGPVVQTDYSFPIPETQWGYAAGFSWDSTLPGTPVSLKADAAYVEFFPSATDVSGELRRTLDVVVHCDSPFLGALQLSPFLDYYLFQDAVGDPVGYNVLFGVSLDYSRLWKPFY